LGITAPVVEPITTSHLVGLVLCRDLEPLALGWEDGLTLCHAGIRRGRSVRDGKVGEMRGVCADELGMLSRRCPGGWDGPVEWCEAGKQ
jgi:hypothetical protein